MASAFIWIVGIFLVAIIGYAIYIEFSPHFTKKESGKYEAKGYRGRITIFSKYGLGTFTEKELIDKKLRIYNIYQIKPNGMALPALTDIPEDTIDIRGKGEEFEAWFIPQGIITEGYTKKLLNQIETFQHEVNIWKNRALLQERQEADNRKEFVETIKEVAGAGKKKQWKKFSDEE